MTVVTFSFSTAFTTARVASLGAGGSMPQPGRRTRAGFFAILSPVPPRGLARRLAGAEWLRGVLYAFFRWGTGLA